MRPQRVRDGGIRIGCHGKWASEGKVKKKDPVADQTLVAATQMISVNGSGM